MRVRFWGTRGSLPAPIDHAAVRAKVRAAILAAQGRDLSDPAALDAFLDAELGFAASGTFGGNTSCVEVEAGEAEFLVLDLGSGARRLGNRIMSLVQQGRPKVVNVLMSHPHWDHVMGFPFFAPAYTPGFTIRILGGHPDLERAFRTQHSAPGFPVEFDSLGARIEFGWLDPAAGHRIAGAEVRLMRQHHSGDSFGYRLESGGRSLIYSTDSEHKIDSAADAHPFVAFFRGADLVIFDAMYSLADAWTIREDWGHSSNIVAVELCQLAGAKALCLFHHDPQASDEAIAEVLADTIRFEALTREARPPLRVLAAYDGLSVDL